MQPPSPPVPPPGGADPGAIDWDRHAGWVLGWFRRRFGVQRAEDLAQDAFLALLRNRHRVRPGGMAPYLLGIVRLLTRAELRRGPRGPVSLAEEPASPRPRHADDDLVAAAVLTLPPELEQVIAVHYGQDLSYERTAAVLGVPRATVQSRLRRALRRLHRELTRAGVRP